MLTRLRRDFHFLRYCCCYCCFHHLSYRRYWGAAVDRVAVSRVAAGRANLAGLADLADLAS